MSKQSFLSGTTEFGMIFSLHIIGWDPSTISNIRCISIRRFPWPASPSSSASGPTIYFRPKRWCLVSSVTRVSLFKEYWIWPNDFLTAANLQAESRCLSDSISSSFDLCSISMNLWIADKCLFRVRFEEVLASFGALVLWSRSFVASPVILEVWTFLSSFLLVWFEVATGLEAVLGLTRCGACILLTLVVWTVVAGPLVVTLCSCRTWCGLGLLLEYDFKSVSVR